MATITSSASCSPSSISVSGTSTSTGTISWSKPTIPDGATINSCVLSGKASSFTTGNKGATLTINDTSVSSGDSFSINLGTNNSTTSITASFKGVHKQTNTSVTLSNLVYTVDYTVNTITYYTVIFVDYDGSVLKTETVAGGNSATAPANPTRVGYQFTGWDKSFTNITSDLTITAQYAILTFTVTFKDWDGSILKTQTVNYGGAALAPTGMNREGYTFTGWDIVFYNVTSDLIVNAIYSEIIINNSSSSFFFGEFNVEKTFLGEFQIEKIYLGEELIFNN